MSYSSFVMEKVGKDKYSELDMRLAFTRPSNAVYVVNVPKNERTKRLNGVDMGSSIDLIFEDDLTIVQKRVSDLKVAAGIARYDGQPAPLVHAQAISARDAAKENHTKYSLYKCA